MSSLPSQGFCSLPQPEMQILCAETMWDVQFSASRGSQLHGIRARASSGHISELHHPSPAHRSDFGHQAFVSICKAQDVLCLESKGGFVSLWSLGSPTEAGTLPLATALGAPAASPALGHPLVGRAALCQPRGTGQMMEHIQLSFCSLKMLH